MSESSPIFLPAPGSSGPKVRVFGRPHSPEAYALRDFLSRSEVLFEWLELAPPAVWPDVLGLPVPAQAALPLVVLPDGRQLFAPSVLELANSLGWVAAPSRHEHDVSIYGAGPAGLSAAVYAASEGLRTVLVERLAVGGQAGTSSLIENYLGFPKGISGAELAERARAQAAKFGVEILLMREGVKSVFHDRHIYTALADGSTLSARANICATGVEWRRLNLPHEARLLGAGVFYGAGVSEAPMCARQHVVVVGGGNSAGQAVMFLARYAVQVTMVVRGASLSIDMSAYLVERIKKAPNVSLRFNAEVTALGGETILREIEITDRRDGSCSRLATSWLFVCIGGAPNTEWTTGTGIVCDNAKYLVTGPDLLTAGRPPSSWPLERLPFYLETSVPGSFAAGDVRHNSVKRVAAAVGEGAMAVTFVHRYLEESA
jgi:thioredoxin reductase (NADPH)